MNIIQGIVKNLINNHPNNAGMTIDFSTMSVEDAVILMMMLLSSDSRRDMKDMLEELDATRLRRRALREARARQRAEAIAERAAAREAWRAAIRERRRAMREARDRRILARRMRRTSRRGFFVPLIFGVILVLVIIGAVFIKFVLIAPEPTPTVPPMAEPAGPAEGTLMLWVDGSTLVFYEGVWIYQSEVTNYQFSLCVEAGSCQPSIVDSLTADFNNPSKAHLPAQGIGPDNQLQYCVWAGGRVPTEAEAPPLGGFTQSRPSGELPPPLPNGCSEGIHRDAQCVERISSYDSYGRLDESSPRARHYCPCLEDAPNSVSIPPAIVDAIGQTIRCVVDAPAPMAPACQTSAYYVNGAPTVMDYSMTKAGEFCQKGVGYVTLDINIPAGGILQSVTGGCQLVDNNRILCSNSSAPNGQGEVFIQHDLLPAVQVNGLPAAGELQCLPGYEVNQDSPTQCDFNKLLPAVHNDSAPAVAQLQSSESQFAGQVSLAVYQPNPLRSANQQQTCPAPLTFSERLGRCVFDIPVGDLARAGRNTEGLPAWNPITGYPPPNADGTCPEGSSLLNGLYCIPDADWRVPVGITPADDPAYRTLPLNADGTCPEGTLLFAGECILNDRWVVDENGDLQQPSWNAFRGYPRPNAEGLCPEGSTLYYGLYCVPNEPAPSEDEAGQLNIELGPWNPLAGYPHVNAEGACLEGSINYFGSCIPNEPPPSEEDGGSPDFGLWQWNPITGYPRANDDGTCPEGSSNYFDRCIPNEDSQITPLILINVYSFCIQSQESCEAQGMDLSESDCNTCISRSDTDTTSSSETEGSDGSVEWSPISGYWGRDSSGRSVFRVPSRRYYYGNYDPVLGYPSPGQNGICRLGSILINGRCLPSEPPPSPNSRCMPGYWYSETLGVCLPDVVLGCPVGTYFDKKEGLCIASGEPTSFTLTGFHFDEASQCSLTDLPSGRYPGCPEGQAFDPSTGACDFKNIYVENGKVLSTVEFNFSAPFCEVKDNSGNSGGSAPSCGSYVNQPSCSSAGCSWNANLNTCN